MVVIHHWWTCHEGDLEGLQVKVASPVAMALRGCGK
jgi:hypothetical protein